MKKLEKYHELEEVCYSYIRKAQTIPTKVLEEMKSLSVTKSMDFQIETFGYYNEVISNLQRGE